jgi:hypothetical protein
LTIKETDGLVRNIQLNNAYNEYKLDPQRFGDIVQTFTAMFSQPASKAAGLDRTRIVPVIKDRQWLDELHNTLKAKGVAQQHLATVSTTSWSSSTRRTIPSGCDISRPRRISVSAARR